MAENHPVNAGTDFLFPKHFVANALKTNCYNNEQNYSETILERGESCYKIGRKIYKI